MLFAVATNAQQVRKVWDFTKGFSAETKSNLAADAKSGSGVWTDMSEQGFYQSKARAAGPAYCLINGEQWIVPETEGLSFGAVSAQHLNISLDDHERGAHIWLNGLTDEDYMVIPQVPAGDSVTIVYETAKLGDNRGIEVKTEGVDSLGESTLTRFTSVGRDTVVLQNNNDFATDVKIETYPRGCRIYYVCVGEKTEYVAPKAKFAYVYDSSFEGYSIEGDMRNGVLLYLLPMRMENAEIINIDIAGDVSAITHDSLLSFKTIIVSECINATNPFVDNLKKAIAFVPMLNFGPSLYEKWGYGKAVKASTGIIDVPEAERESFLFKPSDNAMAPFIDENGQFIMFDGDNINGYESDSYFADDKVLGVAAGVNAIHVHNPNRNAYMLLPYHISDNYAESFGDVLVNAVMMLSATKRNVANVAAPTFSEEYHHLSTNITINGAIDGCTFYYTTDGSTPTTGSTLYTGPFAVSTPNIVVKAIAVADGYLNSEVAEHQVVLNKLVDTPTITFVQESGKSVVTITPANPADVVYYNYVGSNKVAESGLYTGPIEIRRHDEVTAFAAARDELLQSETTTMAVPVKDEVVRIDVLSHMDANKAEWVPVDLGGRGYYHYCKAFDFYTSEVIGQEPGLTPDGLRDTTYNVYAKRDSLYVYDAQNGWEIKTQGEGIVWESNPKTYELSDGSFLGPETPEDASEEMTGSCLSFLDLANNTDGRPNPGSAVIQSTVPFKGPFDIVAYVGSKRSDLSRAEIYITTDTLKADSWTKVGDVLTAPIRRPWKKNVLSYEGTDEVFVKMASCGETMNVYDIIIKNAGEKSGEYTGIDTVGQDGEAGSRVVKTVIYGVNGVRKAGLSQGLNIVKYIYDNGKTKTEKLIVNR